jgi:hypothetical protein
MKVLVNGCSHIEGTELHDNYAQNKKLSWPNFIDLWDINNIAAAGSSNDSITRRTITELEQTCYDFVFVQWSYFNRIELQIPLYKEHGCESEWFCINPGNADQLIDLNRNGKFIHDAAKSIYLKQFDCVWHENYNLSQIILLQSYLKHKNIDYFFGFTTNELFVSNNPVIKLLDTSKLNTVPWLDFCEQNEFKKVVDHYDQAAHTAYANLVNKILKEIR